VSTKKDYAVETLRGVAIFLVVMGHVIGSGPDGGMTVAEDSGWRHLYFTFEYFRMPLFTVISGWVYALRPASWEKYRAFTTKKVRRILLPMIFVGTTYFLLQYLVPGTNKPGELSQIWRIYLFPYTLYWYLPSLFLVFLLVGLLDANAWLGRLAPWLAWTAAAFGLLLLRDTLIPEASPNYFSYKGGIYLLPFFLMGVGIQRFKDSFANRWLNLLLLSLFLLGLAVQQLGWYGIIQYDMDKNSGLGLLIGVAGTTLFFRLKWEIKWLIYFGGFAYSIYLFHSFGTAGGRILLQRAGVENEYLIFAVSLTAGMLGPILAEKILSQFGWTRTLFLGRRYRLAEPGKAVREKRRLEQTNP